MAHHKKCRCLALILAACMLILNLMPSMPDSYAATSTIEYAYLYFYTIDGVEIEKLEKKVRTTTSYTFKDPDEYKYLPEEDDDGNQVYNEYYSQVTGVCWQEYTSSGSKLSQYSGGDSAKFSKGDHYFYVKSDNPTLTGENLINATSSQLVHLYFYTAEQEEELEDLEAVLYIEDEYTFPDPDAYHTGSGTGLYWACTDDNGKHYLFAEGQKATFKAGSYEFSIVTDEPVTITYYYPIDVPTYFTGDETPGETYATVSATVGDVIRLKKSLGAILWGCTFKGWSEMNYEDEDDIFSGGAAYQIMDNVDLSFYAVYEEDDNWDMDATDENKSADELNTESDDLIVDVVEINEQAGMGYGAYVDENGVLKRLGGNNRINSSLSINGIQGKITEKDMFTSLESGADADDVTSYKKDKYGRSFDGESELDQDWNTVLMQDDSALYMDVYGNSFIHYQDLSPKSNMEIAFLRLRDGKTDSWVNNTSDWDSEIIKRFEAIEFAFLYGEYPSDLDGKDLFTAGKVTLDSSVTNGQELIWKNSYISQKAYNDLKTYRENWPGWYDEYDDGLYEIYKAKESADKTGGTTKVGMGSLLEPIRNLFGITAYAEENDTGIVQQIISRIKASLDLDGVTITPQYYDPTQIYSFGSYYFSSLDDVLSSSEQQENLKKVFNALVDMGFTEEAAAGFCGNLVQESSFDPTCVSGAGYVGIVQWGGSRRTGLENYAASMGLAWSDLDAQIGFMVKELNDSYIVLMNNALKYYNGQSSIRTVDDVQTACDLWAAVYEGCVCSNESHSETDCPRVRTGSTINRKYQELAKRREYAQKIYNAMVKSSLTLSAEGLSIPTNGSNNKVPYIPQSGNYFWCSLPFGDGTIASSGCSITSISMVLSYLTGTWIYPSDVRTSIMEHNGGDYKAFHVAGSGADHRIFGAVAGYYGMGCEELSTKAGIQSALANGFPVIMSAQPGSLNFTKTGHFIVITGYDAAGNYYVNDPNSSHSNYSYIKYDLDEIMANGKGYWVIHP